MIKFLLCALVLLACAAGGVYAWLHSAPFGRAFSSKRQARIAASPNWNGTAFSRVEPAEIITAKSRDGLLKAWWKFFTATYPDLTPEVPLPSKKTDLAALPPETDVIPGHGATTTIARELASNPFLRGTGDET